MTGAQVHEARKLLGWSSDRLGAQCGIGGAIILKYEQTGRLSPPRRFALPDHVGADRLGAIRTALEAAGVEFTDGDVPGVKLRKAAS